MRIAEFNQGHGAYVVSNETLLSGIITQAERATNPADYFLSRTPDLDEWDITSKDLLAPDFPDYMMPQAQARMDKENQKRKVEVTDILDTLIHGVNDYFKRKADITPDTAKFVFRAKDLGRVGAKNVIVQYAKVSQLKQHHISGQLVIFSSPDDAFNADGLSIFTTGHGGILDVARLNRCGSNNTLPSKNNLQELHWELSGFNNRAV